MSDPAPMTRFGGGATDPEQPDADGEPHVVLRVLKRVRSAVVLVPLVAGLLFAASTGASKLFADVPERVAAPPEVTCWNGSTAPLASCPAPQGKAGLRWVFPSFRIADTDARCAPVQRRSRDSARPVEFACDLSFDQLPVTVTYSARTAVRQGLAFLARTYGAEGVPEADGDRLAFRSGRADDDGAFRVTVAYAEHPYSVTVEAPEAGLRDAALGELVDFRPADALATRG
ncbi:MAG: hypothetical protein JWN84_2707 [Nocardioides sp.]|nr:hypothetical protein [Nocardioides sp.]